VNLHERTVATTITAIIADGVEPEVAARWLESVADTIRIRARQPQLSPTVIPEFPKIEDQVIFEARRRKVICDLEAILAGGGAT